MHAAVENVEVANVDSSPLSRITELAYIVYCYEYTCANQFILNPHPLAPE